MKIECKLKRRGGTVVELPNPDGRGFDKVKFAPVDPSRESESPHVADVTQAQAMMLLRADANVYVLFDESAAPAPLAHPSAPAPAAPAAPAADVPNPPAPPAGDTQGDGKPADDDKADTNNDGRLSVRELNKGITDGTLTPERLRELLEVEEKAAEPRTSFIAAITKALRA